MKEPKEDLLARFIAAHGPGPINNVTARFSSLPPVLPPQSPPAGHGETEAEKQSKPEVLESSKNTSIPTTSSNRTPMTPSAAIPRLPNPNPSKSPSPSASAARKFAYRSGRWSPDEKILFLYGLKTVGKGRWKKISVYVPHRSLVQIKSHGQKVLKRLEAGENVFRKLDEAKVGVLDSLLARAARDREEILRSGISNDRRHPTAERQSVTTAAGEATTIPSSRSILNSGSESGPGAVIAAAALCQLSSLGTWDSGNGLNVC